MKSAVTDWSDAPARAGDARAGDALAGRMIRIDHAGEFGAINIYRAQIAVSRLLRREQAALLEHFLAHELRHHAIFAALLRERGLRRCRAWLLCGVGGYALGLATALLGSNAVLVCTHAVEAVVNRHLAEQLRYMAARDLAAHAAVASIIADEAEHQHTAAQGMAAHGALARGIDSMVRAATEAVIWSGMRL